MRKLVLLTLAATAAVPATASAQVAHPGPGMHPMPGGGQVFHHQFPRRLQRGFIIPPMWFGPQFMISNWQVHGLRAPPQRHRWVRYYDDAYLVDHDGRIVDVRDRMRWDRDEDWEMVEGIPHRRGHGGMRRHDRDYDEDCGCDDYGEGEYREFRHGPARGEVRVMRPGGPGVAYGGAYGHAGAYGPPPGYGGYGYGYGYGAYGYGGAAVIVETTTTVHADQETSYATEVVEEEYVPIRRRAVRRPPPRRPRPPAGERG